MTTAILFIHILACILLILIVLLQTGKGADMGASFGGGSSQALFGGAGPATILSKITTGIAVVFMLTSLLLAYSSDHKATDSIMSGSGTGMEQTTKADEGTEKQNEIYAEVVEQVDTHA